MKIKKLTAVLIISAAAIFLLTGCPLLRGEPIEVSFTLKNSTDYEIESIWYFSPNSMGSTSPINDILTEKNENLKPGEERNFSVRLYQNQINSGGFMELILPGIEEAFTANGISLDGVKIIEITCDENMSFKFTAVED